MLDTPIDIEASLRTFDRYEGYTQNYNGLPIWKTVDDMERYRAVILATRPEVIIETGTRWGGFAAWLADTFAVQVITVDVQVVGGPGGRHPGVTYITGSSIDPATLDEVLDSRGQRRTMVTLDSDHHYPHVYEEIGLYGPLVSPGCYLVVEDGLADLVGPDEARRFGRDIPNVDGPLRAIHEQLALAPADGEWTRDLAIEAMTPVSHHPAGWWRRRA